MIKKVIKFLDKHRLVLVVLILLLISLIFLGINSLMFFNHKFEALKCNNEIDEIYCLNSDNKIFVDPNSAKNEFFLNNKEDIDKLISNYNLPEFNYYTAYFYLEASSLNFITTGENQELYDFFNTYASSYNLRKFYQKYNFYYDIYYDYKID